MAGKRGNMAETIELTDEIKIKILEKRLRQIARIIYDVDYRAQFADGPVTNTRHEMTDDEMREIYKLAGGNAAAEKFVISYDG